MHAYGIILKSTGSGGQEVPKNPFLSRCPMSPVFGVVPSVLGFLIMSSFLKVLKEASVSGCPALESSGLYTLPGIPIADSSENYPE